MYEKDGLMVKLTDRRCIDYIRQRDEPNTHVVEDALLRKFGFPENEKRIDRRQGRRKNPIIPAKPLPVKIRDKRLIAAILKLRKNGVIQRHTVESALLDMMKKEDAL